MPGARRSRCSSGSRCSRWSPGSRPRAIARHPLRMSQKDRITTPFGFDSTAAEVVDGIDLDRQARDRHRRRLGHRRRDRARAGRRRRRGHPRRAQDRRRRAGRRRHPRHDRQRRCRRRPAGADRRRSIATFVVAWDGPLDILVNNAGVMAIQELTLTDRGREMQFATNHLGHFALALGLHDALAAAGNARIVSVSSSGHLRSPVIFDDLDYAFRDYDPFGAYGQSKTANVLFAVEVTRRWAPDGITSNALMPGGIATALQRHVGGAEYMEEAVERFRQAGSALKTVEQGAATSVLLADVAAAGRDRRALLRGLQRGAGDPAARRRGPRRRRAVRAGPGQRRAALGSVARAGRLTGRGSRGATLRVVSDVRIQAGTGPTLPEVVRRPSRLQALADLGANAETSAEALDRIAAHGLPGAAHAGRAGQPGRRRPPAVRRLRRRRAAWASVREMPLTARLLPVRPRGGRGVRFADAHDGSGARRQPGGRAAGRDRLRGSAAPRRRRRADRDAVRDRSRAARRGAPPTSRSLRPRRQRGRRAPVARRVPARGPSAGAPADARSAEQRAGTGRSGARSGRPAHAGGRVASTRAPSGCSRSTSRGRACARPRRPAPDPEVVARHDRVPLEAQPPLGPGWWGPASRTSCRRARTCAIGSRRCSKPCRTSGSVALLPLTAGEQCLGVLGVGFADERPMSDEDRGFLSAIAGISSLALARAGR